MSETPKKRAQSPVAVESEDMAAYQEREAQRQRARSVQPKVKQEWFEWVMMPTLDPKKGRKLVRKQLTENGVNTEYVGFEKKIPVGFKKSIADRIKPAGWKP